MVVDTELLILGGGCAGLSLARDLAAHGQHCPSTRIVEQRVRYENDRTWCFWGDDEIPGVHLAQHHWSQVELRAHQRTVVFNCGAQRYRMISGLQFYEDALQRIAACGQVHLETGVHTISEPSHVDGMWQIETSAGLRRARRLIDTRAINASGEQHAAPILWQSFYGQEIVCEDAPFDPSTVMLMDFIEGCSDRITFIYVLPLSSTRALIEVTVFGPLPLSVAELQEPLRQQIQTRLQHRTFAVARSEHGVLPMGLPSRKRKQDPTYIRAGLMHGAARASTGYAFQRIQRWSKDCAQRLAAGAALIAQPSDPLLMRGMDHLFLTVLRQRPELGAQLFLTMFKRCDSKALIRFLSDRASLLDYLRIVIALPARPFIGQLGHLLTGAR